MHVINLRSGCHVATPSRTFKFKKGLCKVDLKDSCVMRHLTVTTRMCFAVIFVMQICVTHERSALYAVVVLLPCLNNAIIIIIIIIIRHSSKVTAAYKAEVVMIIQKETIEILIN